MDVARGVASLIMIQGHAYDGWVDPAGKETVAYAFTRLLGSLPLPAFLVLAGAAVTLRVEAARHRGEPARSVRAAVAWRGLTVVLWGYASSFAYALLDGHQGLDTLLRADVLQVIGVSIALTALVGIRGDGRTGAPGRASLAWAAVGLAALPTLACPWLAPLGHDAAGPWRYLVGLFVDVPGVTRMPVVPLVSWLALGVLVALRMTARPGSLPAAGASDRWLLGLAVGSAAVALVANRGMAGLLAARGGELSRAHPAVWLNVVDLGARGVLVLAVGALLSQRVGSAAKAALLRLGRGSLYAYMVHVPFCYGLLGAPLRGRLDMASATAAVLGLMGLSYLTVVGVDAWRRRRRRPGPVLRPG
ncbi:MAG: heparan-alpha-glucosaminide N-acetyltransferase domain-containing protein [Sandaracinaceae bacterium]